MRAALEMNASEKRQLRACGNCNRMRGPGGSDASSTRHPDLSQGPRIAAASGRRRTRRCVLGYLWITEEGDDEDRIIANGESFVLNRPGLSLATALTGPALVVVQPGRVFGTHQLWYAA